MPKPISIFYNGREKCKACELSTEFMRLEIDEHIIIVCGNCLIAGIRTVIYHTSRVEKVARVR